MNIRNKLGYDGANSIGLDLDGFVDIVNDVKKKIDESRILAVPWIPGTSQR